TASGTRAATAARAVSELVAEPAVGRPLFGGTGTPASIAGVVLGAGDRPLRGVCVTARSQGSTSVRTNAAAAAAAAAVLTGADGRYELVGLRRGAYTISYRDCADPGAYFEQWSGGAELASDA